MPETCPECGVIFSSYRSLSIHMDKEHPHEYTAHAMAVLENIRQHAQQDVLHQPARVEAARARNLAPGEPALPPPPAMRSPYVGDLGDARALFGNRRTLNYFLRHEDSVRSSPPMSTHSR